MEHLRFLHSLDFKRIRCYGFWNRDGLKRATQAIQSQSAVATEAVLSMLAIAAKLREEFEEFSVLCPESGERAFEVADMDFFDPSPSNDSS